MSWRFWLAGVLVLLAISLPYIVVFGTMWIRRRRRREVDPNLEKRVAEYRGSREG